MSHIDNYQENDDDLRESEDGEVVQLGLNGKPLDDQSYTSKVYVSNKPRIRLDGSKSIDYHLINKFVSQIKNEPGDDLVIEKLIDSVSWKSILRIAKGLNQDKNSVSQSQRLQQILLLETYVFTKEGEVFNIDNKVWNNTTICQLLQDCYPESLTSPNTSEHVSTRLVAIHPRFNLADPSIEAEFVRKVEYLLENLGEGTVITSSQVTFIYQAWVKMWPNDVQARWKLFIVNRESISTLSTFLDHFIAWLIDARRVKAQFEHVGYIVTPGPSASWFG
jgi:hypothetical protein